MGQWRGKCYYLGFGTWALGSEDGESTGQKNMEVVVRGLRLRNEKPTRDQVTC